MDYVRTCSSSSLWREEYRDKKKIVDKMFDEID